MDLNKLYYFYIVAEHQHVTRASEELHIAQPALTKAIKILESELGVPLFYKNKRNIYLTQFGSHLKSRLDNVFSVLDNIPDELTALKAEARNTIKLNVLAASTTITAAIVNYKKKNDHVIFQVIQNEEEHDCDISVTTSSGTVGMSSYEKRYVIEENIFLAVPKISELAAKDSVALKAVGDMGFVNLAGSRLFRTICDRFCLAAGFHPKIIFESDSPVTVKNLIGAGAGIGFWPAFSWGEASSDIKLLPITDPVCKRNLIIELHNVSSLSDASLEFYEYLVEFMKKQQEERK